MDMLTAGLGLIASAGFITSNYALKMKWILIFQGVGMAAVGSMFAVRAVVENQPAFWGPAIVNALFITRNVILYYRDKKALPSGGVSSFERRTLGTVFFVVIVGTYIFVSPIPGWSSSIQEHLMFLLPLGATVTNVLALAQGKLVALKWFILVSVSCWATFDIVVGAWTTLIGDGFGIIATIIALWRIRKENRKAEENVRG